VRRARARRHDRRCRHGRERRRARCGWRCRRGGARAQIYWTSTTAPGASESTSMPVDAVTTSASGIDPDISIANADIQAHRIAAVRHLSLSSVDRMISRYTSGRGLGFSGEPAGRPPPLPSISVSLLSLGIALRLGASSWPAAARHGQLAADAGSRDRLLWRLPRGSLVAIRWLGAGRLPMCGKGASARPGRGRPDRHG